MVPLSTRCEFFNILVTCTWHSTFSWDFRFYSFSRSFFCHNAALFLTIFLVLYWFFYFNLYNFKNILTEKNNPSIFFSTESILHSEEKIEYHSLKKKIQLSEYIHNTRKQKRTRFLHTSHHLYLYETTFCLLALFSTILP